MSKPIGWIGHIYYSERDYYGNCYWAFAIRRASDGASAYGRISGGESNILAAFRQLADEGGVAYDYATSAVKKREFKNMTADWPYAGCAPDDIAAFIRNKIGGQT